MSTNNYANSFKFISKENLLSLIHCLGLEMKALTSPYSHPYDDERRAKPYVEHHKSCQRAYWLALNNDVAEALEALSTVPRSNLIAMAVAGGCEQPEEFFKNMRASSFHWVTYKGDFYGVSAGDRLNLPCVHRVANEYLPKELKTIEGCKAIAAMMPNPCTRITAPIQVH